MHPSEWEASAEAVITGSAAYRDGFARSCALGRCLAELDVAASEVTYGRGEILHNEGEHASHVHLILSGMVKDYRALPDGRRHVFAFRDAGSIIDIEWLCADSEAVARSTVEAVTEMVVHAYPLEATQALFASDETARAALLSDLLGRLEASREKSVSLGCQTAVSRLSGFLLELAVQTDCGAWPTEGGIPIRMSRRDIADHLGLTLETVCRSFGHLKDDGVISLDNPHIFHIERHHTLLNLAEGHTRR